MDKRRVLLLSDPSLLSEGLAHLLGRTENVEVVGPWTASEWNLKRHAQSAPHVVLVAEPEEGCDHEIAVTSQILEHYVDLPVIRVCLTDTEMRVHLAHRLRAHVENLIKIVGNISANLDR